MGYQAKFTGWQNITLEDLIVAYRKAKADCFFENIFPIAVKFAEFEQDLLFNLETLLNLLQKDNGFANNQYLLGKFRLIPKKLSIYPKKNAPTSSHVHFSNPDRAFKHLLKNNDIKPEFRIIGDFPVETHIISALWINTIGHQFDAKLDQRCYGARVKRINNEELFSEKPSKPFHISAIGSFTPYFQPYQQWRSDGLAAIRGELEKKRGVIAVSLDLKSYYHFIDPMAVSTQFYEELDLDLTIEEQEFTNQLVKLLTYWGKEASLFAKDITDEKKVVSGGLVIGLTASRIISNVLLYRWDKLIKEKLAPIHYGRYIDDMFLVLHDTDTICNNQDFMEFLQARLGSEVVKKIGEENDHLWEIQQGQDFQGTTKIQLQSDKQKLFLLQGQAGFDLLDSIEKEIYELSSEHRLMPSPDQLEDSTAARVLSAAGSVGESADTLRRADGLTIRRLSWSLQLRQVETLARDLPPQEWKQQREEFYQFAHNHILRPDNLFAHFNYLPRLLGFAISMNEWEQAEQIVRRAYQALAQLADATPIKSEITINGTKTKVGNKLWPILKSTLSWLFIDAAARYYDPNQLLLGHRSKKEQYLAELFLKGILASVTDLEDLFDLPFDFEDFHIKAPLVALADLAKEPYKSIIRSHSAEKLIEKQNIKINRPVIELFKNSNLINTRVLKDFLRSTRDSRLKQIKENNRKRESYLPYLFPTRPLTPAEISELAPECVGLPKINGKLCEEKPSIIWAKYTQAIRGVWIKPSMLTNELDEHKQISSKQVHPFLRIGTEKKHVVTIAFTNFKTDDSDWRAMACNKPNLSKERYQRISEMVNQAIRLNPKPDYLLFPELSIPLKWIDSIATRLTNLGISLIAGTEYRHLNEEQLLSEACLVLSDNRLGYPASVKIWQPKLEPAVGEDKELTLTFGKTWAFERLKASQVKPVYIHNQFYFAVMVCSELQNSKARIAFQGEIDALMVLSWNQDLDTFSSLIESAALDIHAYTILVNNRKYGDSRIRSPAKESFMRDIARVRGGTNDFVVAATLEIDALREFQSRAKRWPQEGDKFKPLPEGFKLATGRKKLPPK
ncbi:MAG: RNA-directed DNA polymerase [Pseudomonadota bacterium]